MLKAPNSFVSAQIDEVDVVPDENGFVAPLHAEHETALRSLGFYDPAEREAASQAALMSTTSLTPPSSAAEAVLIDVWTRYPFITKALSTEDGTVPDPQQTAEQLLDAIEAHIGERMETFEALRERFIGAGGEGENDDTLYGSSVLPAVIEAGGYKVQLGGIVAAAHAFSGLSVADWNDLPEQVREAKLNDIVSAVDEGQAPAIALIPETSILERPAAAPEGGQGGQTAPAEAQGHPLFVDAAGNPADPAEKPDFDTWSQADLVAFCKVEGRGVKFRGNPSQGVAAQSANDYWAEKHPTA